MIEVCGFQIPLTISWEGHAEMLLKIITSLETPLIYNDTEIKTPADLAIGLDMCKENMTELKSKDIPRSTLPLAEKLETIYESIRTKTT